MQKNEEFAGFITDDDFRVRFAEKFTKDGSNLILTPDGKGGWKEFLKIPSDDALTTNVVSFTKKGDAAYVIDSRKRDTGAFTLMDLRTRKQTVLAADPRG